MIKFVRKEIERKSKANVYIRKQMLIDSFKKEGCSVCGYKRCLGALDFHHVSGVKNKKCEVRGVHGLSEDAIREEVKKCIVVCANCHREIEAGVTVIKRAKEVEGQGKLAFVE